MSACLPATAARDRGKATGGPALSTSVVNVLTVDVEDYFQVSAFEHRIRRAEWPQFESRVCRNTELLLELFEGFGVQATFFVLGWVASRFPALVRRIAHAGHELASHGFHHELVCSIGQKAFRSDILRARRVLEDAAGVRVVGYRAPSFSVNLASLWALDVLIEEGYTYDASIFPIRHDRYGVPCWARHVHQVIRPSGAIWELPGSTVRVLGANLPFGGGGYLRLFPFAWTRAGIHHLNEVEGQPAVVYVHPWELDPDQPRLEGSFISRLRHYTNLDKTAGRLRRLLAEFRFGPVSAVLAQRSRTADMPHRTALTATNADTVAVPRFVGLETRD